MVRGDRVDLLAPCGVRVTREAAANLGNVGDSTWQAALDAGWSDTELTELSVHITLNLFTNYVNHLGHTHGPTPKGCQRRRDGVRVL